MKNDASQGDCNFADMRVVIPTQARSADYQIKIRQILTQKERKKNFRKEKFQFSSLTLTWNFISPETH